MSQLRSGHIRQCISKTAPVANLNSLRRAREYARAALKASFPILPRRRSATLVTLARTLHNLALASVPSALLVVISRLLGKLVKTVQQAGRRERPQRHHASTVRQERSRLKMAAHRV